MMAINVGGQTECQDDVGDVFELSAYGPNAGFRLQCDRISGADTVSVVFELVAMKPESELPIRQATKETPYDPHKPDTPGGRALEIWRFSVFDLFTARPIPHAIKFIGNYERNRQPFSLNRTSLVERAN
jgi:hypothetical protein